MKKMNKNTERMKTGSKCNLILKSFFIISLILISMLSISIVSAQQECNFWCRLVYVLTGKMTAEYPALPAEIPKKLGIQEAVYSTQLTGQQSACNTSGFATTTCMPGGLAANWGWYNSWGPITFRQGANINRTIKIYHSPWAGTRNFTVYLGASCGSQSTEIFKKEYVGNMDCNNTGYIDVSSIAAGNYYITADWTDAGGGLSSDIYNLSFSESIIPCGMNLTQNINLTSDLSCSGTALNLGADNIIIDCKGNSIIGNGTGVGINATSELGIEPYTNLTIKNCIFSNFSDDVDMSPHYFSSLGLTGGSITVINSNISTIATYGGDGNDFGGNAGSAMLIDSTVINISAHGGYRTSPDSDGGDGGEIVLINSSVTSINTNGTDGSGAFGQGGNAGNVTMINSKITLGGIISLSRGNGNFANGIQGTLKLNQTEIGNPYGTIKFSYVSTKNLTFSQIANVSSNLISLDSNTYPEYNVSSDLTLKGLAFSNPIILRDGVNCPSSICTMLNYSSGNLLFYVSSFTDYSAAETPSPRAAAICSEAWNCTEWNSCANGKQTRTCGCICSSSTDCTGDNSTEKDCCTDECISGIKECANTDAWKQCGNYDADNCTEWSSNVNCAADETCQNGNCVCVDECLLGKKECSSDIALKQCGNYDNDSCTEWSIESGCASEEICQNGNCIYSALPMPLVCTSKFVCEAWSECLVSYSIEDLLKGKLITGEQSRLCEDVNGCRKAVLQTKDCVKRIPVRIEKEYFCSRNYISIYSEETGALLARIIENLATEQKLDVELGVLADKECWYCIDGIRDYDEVYIDCGNSCPECVLDKYLDWIVGEKLELHLSAGTRVHFTVRNESYSLISESIAEPLLLKTDSMIVSLKAGETKIIDINKDNSTDISITFNRIEGSKALVLVQNLAGRPAVPVDIYIRIALFVALVVLLAIISRDLNIAARKGAFKVLGKKIIKAMGFIPRKIPARKQNLPELKLLRTEKPIKKKNNKK